MSVTIGGDFTSLSQQLKTDVQEISQNVSSLQRFINQLGTPLDDQSLRSQLHELQQRTNHLAKSTNVKVRQLSQLSRTGTANEQQERRIFVQKITNDFFDVLNTFQGLQRSAAEKEKQIVLQDTRAVKPRNTATNPFYENDDTFAAEPEIGAYSQPRLVFKIEEEEENERNSLELIKEQNASIRQLESDIVDVNQIFQELATMIHEQGSIIDNIESNVENTQMQVESGNVQLRRAADYQISARKKKLLIIIILTIILMMIILIIFLTSK